MIDRLICLVKGHVTIRSAYTGRFGNCVRCGQKVSTWGRWFVYNEEHLPGVWVRGDEKSFSYQPLSDWWKRFLADDFIGKKDTIVLPYSVPLYSLITKRLYLDAIEMIDSVVPRKLLSIEKTRSGNGRD